MSSLENLSRGPLYRLGFFPLRPWLVQAAVDLPGQDGDEAEPADLSNSVGTLHYYKDRADDFRLRHPGQAPPDYYLDYGDKYACRFHDELRPRLSPEGQVWLDKTLTALQSQMEEARSKNPTGFARLEENSYAFRRYAFSTHPKAYLESGLATLPLQDDIKILRTPDLKDRLSPEGLEQLAFATKALVEHEDPRKMAIALWNTVGQLKEQMLQYPGAAYIIRPHPANVPCLIKTRQVKIDTPPLPDLTKG